jgi:hypothetical protein
LLGVGWCSGGQGQSKKGGATDQLHDDEGYTGSVRDERKFALASRFLQARPTTLAAAAQRSFALQSPVTLEAHRMSTVVKVIEVIAQSEKSFDDAAQNAVKEVAKTVQNIKSIWIDNLTGTVDGNRITEYRVNAKVSFLVEGHK